MIPTFRVGILIPGSSIIPMGRLFVEGFRKQLVTNQEVEIEIVKEFIGQSSIKQVQDAITKLLEFEDVDAVTGIISSRTAVEVAEVFAKNDKVFLLNNLGETILSPESVTKNVLLNSPLLWQQLWSLGNWATKEFGPKGMFVGGVYDMAYCFSYALDKGMNAASDEANWSFAVSHMPSDGGLSDPNVVFEYIESEKPDFLFAAFCGEEATLFLNEFIDRGLYSTMPLLSLPYLMEDYNREVPNDLLIYSTISVKGWNQFPDLDNPWVKPVDIFYQMGKDSANIMIALASGKDVSQISTRTFLEVNNLSELEAKASGQGNSVYLVKNYHSGKKEALKREVMKKLETIDIQSPDLQDYFKGLQASWNNPYLGV